MAEPQIEANRLADLSERERWMFPANSILEANQITCPIRNSADARNFFRAIFRLNRAPNTTANSEEVHKQRITLAFEGIRSLNELSRGLQGLKQNRAKHVLRDGVKFFVGQVVKHKTEDWRGVVIGWRRFEPNTKGQTDHPTSLTKKSYELDPEDTIKYTILLDSGDAHLHYSKRKDSSILSQADVHQTEIELVQDKRYVPAVALQRVYHQILTPIPLAICNIHSLLRIRNTHLAQFVKRFDAATNTFEPNELLAYEYPKDLGASSQADREATPDNLESEKVAMQIISGAEDMSDYLRRIILDHTSAPESRKLKLLSLFLDRILKLSSGDILPIKDRLTEGSTSTTRLAVAYLQALISLSEDIGDLLWHRRRFGESVEKIHFAVGDVVKHTEYGFRGVIVAIDPEPTVDVSRWDGLQHIKNPEMYPFYHIIPDQGDCIQAFGGERPSRYVCEANLVSCPPGETNIGVDLGPEWKHDLSRGNYVPPDDVKFKYGFDLDDDGLTKQCMMELRDALTKMLIGIRDGSSSGRGDLDAAVQKLSMSNIMQMLKYSENLDAASTISDCLKEIWRAHPNGDLKFRLDEAINALLSGKTEHALALFTDLIREDPNYAEAWNKASTCEFMLGNMEASLAAAQKALDILPDHVQAQNGLGLVYFEKKEYAAAVECFRKSLELDPWSPVSARLSVCIDTLWKWEKSPVPQP